MAEPARRLSPSGAAPELPPALASLVRSGARRRDAASAPGAVAPAPWSRDALAGRLVEISSSGEGAPLTLATVLVLDAQRRRETVAWITSRDSAFFPPDVAASGVDLDALVVVRLPAAAPAPRRRREATGAVDLSAVPRTARADSATKVRVAQTAARGEVTAPVAAAGPTAPAATRCNDRAGGDARAATLSRVVAGRAAGTPDASRAVVAPSAERVDRAADAAGVPATARASGATSAAVVTAAARAADRLLRSGAFGLVVIDLGRGDVTMPMQARLVGLAERHDAAVVCLTEKPRTAPSLSSLVSLRVEAHRRRAGDGVFACSVEALKDKRRPPGWTHEEVCLAPPGLR